MDCETTCSYINILELETMKEQMILQSIQNIFSKNNIVINIIFNKDLLRIFGKFLKTCSQMELLIILTILLYKIIYNNLKDCRNAYMYVNMLHLRAYNSNYNIFIKSGTKLREDCVLFVRFDPAIFFI